MMLKTVALLAFSAAAFAQPTVTAVVNSTNYLPQLCPGMFASVYGTNFGTNAANVSVTVGGKPAYVYASSLVATQFAIEIPFEVSPGATTLIVTVSGAQSAPFNITLATYAPSFLTQNSTGSGPATVY
ncbi:MAG: IPT/TIG domain-containing protein, partial [Bryobacteraceae bacterium]